MNWDIDWYWLVIIFHAISNYLFDSNVLILLIIITIILIIIDNFSIFIEVKSTVSILVLNNSVSQTARRHQRWQASVDPHSFDYLWLYYRNALPGGTNSERVRTGLVSTSHQRLLFVHPFSANTIKPIWSSNHFVALKQYMCTRVQCKYPAWISAHPVDGTYSTFKLLARSVGAVRIMRMRMCGCGRPHLDTFHQSDGAFLLQRAHTLG